MHTSSLTLLVAISEFIDVSYKVRQIPPGDVTRFAFYLDRDWALVEISNQLWPHDNDLIELVDVFYFASDKIGISGIDRALVVRLMSTDDLPPGAIQVIGQAIDVYMNQNGCDQFVTAAISDTDQGKNLTCGWNTFLFLRGHDGKWIFENLGAICVQKSVDDCYAILKDGKMTNVASANLVSTLLTQRTISHVLDTGFQVDGKGTTVCGHNSTRDVRARIPVSKTDSFFQVCGSAA